MGQQHIKVAFLMQERSRLYGAELAVLDLLRGLGESGRCQVQMLFIREERVGGAREVAQAYEKSGINVIPLAVRRRLSGRLVKEIRDSLDRGGIQILHTIGNKADFYGYLAARRAGVAQVATVHGWLFRPDWMERFYEWLDWQMLRRCRRVVVLSRYYRDLLLKQGLEEERVVLIPSGYGRARLPEREAAERRPQELVLGFMGRMSEEKNPADALQVLAAIKRKIPRARLVMAGEGVLLESLKQQAAAQGLADAVDFLGYQQPERFFPNVSVLLCTSRIENLPVCVMEAMAWGRPVIAYRVGGLPDLVEDGATGYLVAPGDVAAMAQKVMDLAADEGTATRLGAAARKRLEEEFTVEQCVQKHLELYRALVGEQRGEG